MAFNEGLSNRTAETIPGS